MMRKISLVILALFASVNLYAATTAGDDLSAAVNKSIKQQSSTTNQPSTIVYGGKDISRSIVASADASTWTRKPILVG